MPPQRALQNNPGHVPWRLPRRALRAGAATLMALGLAVCSNSPYPRGEAAESILYLAQADDPKTLAPSVAGDSDSERVIGLLYSSYFQYHYLKRDPFILEPALGAAKPTRRPVPVTITKDKAGYKTHLARRWVAERTFSWLSRWRGILVRWDKKPRSYLANVKLACALLWMRGVYQAGSRLTVSEWLSPSIRNDSERPKRKFCHALDLYGSRW